MADQPLLVRIGRNQLDGDGREQQQHQCAQIQAGEQREGKQRRKQYRRRTQGEESLHEDEHVVSGFRKVRSDQSVPVIVPVVGSEDVRKVDFQGEERPERGDDNRGNSVFPGSAPGEEQQSGRRHRNREVLFEQRRRREAEKHPAEAVARVEEERREKEEGKEHLAVEVVERHP